LITPVFRIESCDYGVVQQRWMILALLGGPYLQHRASRL